MKRHDPSLGHHERIFTTCLQLIYHIIGFPTTVIDTHLCRPEWTLSLFRKGFCSHSVLRSRNSPINRSPIFRTSLLDRKTYPIPLLRMCMSRNTRSPTNSRRSRVRWQQPLPLSPRPSPYRNHRILSLRNSNFRSTRPVTPIRKAHLTDPCRPFRLRRRTLLVLSQRFRRCNFRFMRPTFLLNIRQEPVAMLLNSC